MRSKTAGLIEKLRSGSVKRNFSPEPTLKAITLSRRKSVEPFIFEQTNTVNSIAFNTYLRDTKPESVDREDIEALLHNGFTLRSNPLYSYDHPFNWGADPNKDTNWRFRVNALDPLEPLIAYYIRTTDIEVFQVVQRRIFDWIQYNLVDANNNSFRWWDMSTGIRATRLAFLYVHGLRLNTFSDEQILQLLMAMDLHIQELTKPEALNPGNHGLFQMLGVAAICKAAPILRTAHNAKKYANETFQKLVDTQFTTEGIHKEHSSQYHAWAIRQIEEMLDCEYFERFNTQILERAKSNIIHFFYPDGSITLLGDSGNQNISSLRSMHPLIDRLYGNDDSLETPQATRFDFRESGYVILRNDWNRQPIKTQSYFLFNGAFHSSTHKHADDMSLLWYERARPILVDSGKYSYNNDQWRQYAKSTRAHNTVEIDRASYPITSDAAFGSAIKQVSEVEDGHLIEAEVVRRNPALRHRRLVAVFLRRFLFVVDIIDNTDAEHEYRQWFHFHESLEVTLDHKKTCTVSNQIGTRMVTGAFYADTPNNIVLCRGIEKPEIQGWISRTYLDLKPNFALGNVTEGGDTILAAGYSLALPDTDTPIQRLSEREFQFDYGRGRHMVLNIQTKQLYLFAQE